MADKAFGAMFSKRLLSFPGDLTAVLIFLGACLSATFLPGLRETPLRVLCGVPLVLFVPGYVVTAALFPRRASPQQSQSNWLGTGLDGVERIGLSIGLSIVIGPFLALLLHFSPWALALEPVTVSLVGFTLLWTLVAGARRLALPSVDRFRVPYRDWLPLMSRPERGDEPASRLALRLFLVAMAVVAVGSIGYVVGMPPQGEEFTEFSLLGESDTDSLAAENFTDTMAVDETNSVTVGVTNHERESVSYSVVLQLQRVGVSEDETLRVEQRETVARAQTGPLDAGEQWRSPVSVTPTMTGERLRLVFLLYPGEPPANPTVDNAYRNMHLWVTVTEQ